MSFGSFLQGIVAQVNPFDNGKTYGSYNPPKKKLQPGDPGYVAPVSSASSSSGQQNAPRAQRPQNLFQGLRNDIGINAPVNKPANTVPVQQNQNTAPVIKPQPGAVIHPTVQNHPIFGPLSPTTPGPAPFMPPPTVREISKPESGILPPHMVNVPGQTAQVPYSSTIQPPKPPSTIFAKPKAVFASPPKKFSTPNAGPANFKAQAAAVPLSLARTAVGIPQGIASLFDLLTPGKGTNRVTKVLNRGANAIQTKANKVAASDPSQTAGYLYNSLQLPENLVAGSGIVGETAKSIPVVGRAIEAGQNLVKAPFRALNRVVSPKTADLTKTVANAAPSAASAKPSTPVQIPVRSSGGRPPKVNVQVKTGQPIIEVGGDTPGKVRLPTREQVDAARAAKKFASQPSGRPDQNIEGVTTNPANIVTTADKTEAQSVLDDKLATNQITDDEHKALSNELSKIPAADEPVPKGKPIKVKTVDSIPVQDQTVPTGLPETPGTVRPTVSTASKNAETQAIANASPTAPPKEVLTKRQVAAARNQLKLARQLTKTQKATAEVRSPFSAKMSLDELKSREGAPDRARVDEYKQKLANGGSVEPLLVSREADGNFVTDGQHRLQAMKELGAKEADVRFTNPNKSKGFVPSGEFNKGVRGNVSEAAHKMLEEAKGAHDTTNLSAGDVLEQARQEINDNGIHSPQTVRNLKAIRDSGRFARTSPEFKAINDEYKNAISSHGRALALTDRTARTSATGDQLTNRFTSKLLAFADDSGKIKDSDIAEVTQAENAFTDARDTANTLGERFKTSGSQQDFDAWKGAQKQSEDADREAKITEYLVSKRVLAGNKDLDAAKAVQDAEKKAGVYSMDTIDANMLSGTGTMVRNYINTLFPRAENKLFGKASSLAVRKLAPIGGTSGRGGRLGAKIGQDVFKADVAARKQAGVGFIRRTVTAGNQLGERNIEATTYSRAFDHYKQLLKSEGYTGKDLDNRAEFNVRTDPDGLVQQYRQDTLQANALSSLTSGNKKVENILSDGIQRKLAEAGVGHTGQVVGRTAAKAVTRVGLGFPTVIARSLVEGLKRATLGIPEAGWSTLKYLKTGNASQYAGELSKAIQHAGSGGGLILLGHELGKLGVISGAYPSDPAERARWQAEGKQENSIKIGNQWFSIPGYFGGFGLPIMLGASTADGGVQNEASLGNVWNTILSASPVDNIQSTLEILTGNSSASKEKNAVTSLARAFTPAGSFVAEVAKLVDPTQNDTTTKGAAQNILDNIAGGIPLLNNAINTIPKTDAYGNVLKNPNPAAQLLGAQGSQQGQGVKDVNKDQAGANSTLDQLSKYGVTSDKNLLQLIDPKLRKEIADGQQLDPQDVAKVQKSVTKGVSATEDSNWRESEDYSTDKAALQTKLQLLNADPTTKPSEKQKYQTQIKRDDVLEANKVPYDTLKLYETTGLTAWREMGNSKSESYDPDTYQKLWNIDQLMTKGQASYNKTSPSKQKYSAKSSSSGGKGGSSSISGSFGALKPGVNAPTIKSYQSIDQQSGNVPVIQVVRPNIVHKISSSG